MNENHVLCSTPEAAEFMESEVLEPLTPGLDLGNEMLEIGPGPAAATHWLRHRMKRLVALELDSDAAASLADARAPARLPAGGRLRPGHGHDRRRAPLHRPASRPRKGVCE